MNIIYIFYFSKSVIILIVNDLVNNYNICYF